ncbi:MAG: methionyl-tRNA formyltransferase [Baekduia sp.]
MGVVYLATAQFAADVLAGLARGRWRPDLVVTRPDARRGRGRTLAPPPVAVTAAELGIPVIQPEQVNDDTVAAQIDATAGPNGRRVLCAFGALIAEPLISGPPIYNVHPSLLPRWRGAAPIERAIEAGDSETGVSIMRLVPELDAGPVYAQQAVAIEPGETFGSIVPRLVAASVELLESTLAQPPEPVPQPETGVTYAEKIGAADRTIDPADAVASERTVRALHPHIGARIELPGGEHMGIEQARIGAGGRFEPLVVKPAGGRAMTYEEYVRGHGPLPLG